MFAEAIQQAVIQTYLDPLDRLIERKAKIFSAITARDPFSMTDEDAARHQRRLKEIAEEVELLGHLRTAVSDLNDIYHRRLEAAERSIGMLQHDIQQIGLDYITFRQCADSFAQINTDLLDMLIIEIQKRKAA